MAELALTGIGHLTTNDGDPVEDAVIVFDRGVVEYAGPAADAPMMGDTPTVECEGSAVIPAFIDAHTHLVFAGDRAGEFGRKMAGEPYMSIAASGGGIMSTVRATRAATREELEASTRARLMRLMNSGVAGIEIKSGYGLDVDSEAILLEVARSVGSDLGIPVRATFLGAHAIPPEHADDRDGYVTSIIEEMIPAVTGLADDCDVFVEKGAFTVEEARAILERAAGEGMGLRVHAEQMTHSGGAMLAAELGAMSADHLDHATPEDAEALAGAGVAAVLTPGASHMLRSPQAPGPMLWEAGCVVALATDCNPGTSYVEAMGLVVSLAVVEMGLSVEQAIWAATRGGALALGWPERGWIREGAPGDVLVLDAPTPDHIPYRPATNLVRHRVVRGRISTAVDRQC